MVPPLDCFLVDFLERLKGRRREGRGGAIYFPVNGKTKIGER